MSMETIHLDGSSDDKQEEIKQNLEEESSQKSVPVKERMNWKQAFIILVISTLVSFVILAIAVLISNKLSLSHNDDLHDRVLQLEEMLQNASARISELEDRRYHGTISELQVRVDQLKGNTTALEASKASQDEVDQLSIIIAELNDSTTISNSKIWTSRFLHLSERVDDINDTTVEFSDLAMKVTSLEGDIERINTTLATKANQQHVDEIMNMTTTLRETTVRRDEFQGLVTTVETLQSSKANQSDLDDLKDTVTSLNQTTKTELDSLRGSVMTAQNLTSHINENDVKIQRLQNNVSIVEGDIEELKSEALRSEASRSVASWLIITKAIITIHVFMYNV